jgi:hypothetical protein
LLDARVSVSNPLRPQPAKGADVQELLRRFTRMRLNRAQCDYECQIEEMSQWAETGLDRLAIRHTINLTARVP